MADTPLGFELTPLLEAVSGLHELYAAFQQGGFTQEEAMTLVTAIMLSTTGSSGAGEE